jgi:prophage regulatory protein
MPDQNARPTRILRRPEVESRSGMKRSTLYDAIKAGRFPAPIRLAPRVCGWVEAEVEAWLAGCIESSRGVR